MLLAAEIFLTITAWRRGWKAYALLPGGLTLLLGFLIGLSIGASGGSADSIPGATILLDIACVISLIIMSAKPRKQTVPQIQNSAIQLTEEPSEPQFLADTEDTLSPGGFQSRPRSELSV